MPMVGPNPLGGGDERVVLLGAQGVERGFESSGPQLQRGHRGRLDAVEQGRVLEYGGVAARPHVGDDISDRGVDRLVMSGVNRRQSRKRRGKVRGRRIETAHFSHEGQALLRALAALGASAVPGALGALRAMASSNGWSESRLSLSDAGLTINRALIAMISSTATRSLALSVLPLLTRSTMASASPTSGASSIDPYSLIRSTCMPLAAKCSRAVVTYLVATERRAPRFSAPP